MKTEPNNKTRVLLVDDELSVRELLKDMLSGFDYLDIVGEARNVPEAVKLIHKHQPDLIFLDIEMPGYSGLKLLDFLNEEEIVFDIVFVTAFDEYAIKAFKLAAFDYLLKPVDENQLRDTLKRYLKKESRYQTSNRIDLLKATYRENEILTRIAIPSTYGIEFVDIKDIVILEAENNYTRLILNNNKELMASKPLSEFESMLLPSSNFFRAHRSYLINLKEVAKLNLKDGVFIEMKSGKSIPLSRYRRKDFEEIFKSIKI